MCSVCVLRRVVVDCFGELRWGVFELQFDSGDEFLREAIHYRHAEIGGVLKVVDVEWISWRGR